MSATVFIVEDDADTREMMAAGREGLERIDVDAYLPKPVDLDELLQRVTEYCRP